MKVLLASPFYSPGVGGSSRLLQDIVDHLQVRGHVVEVLTYGPPHEDYLAFDRSQSYPIYRIPWQRIPGTSSLLMLAKFVSLTAAGGKNRYDLILSGVAYPTALLVSVAHRLFRVPFVVYSFGEDVTCVQDAPRRKVRLSAALRRARAVLTISRFTFDKIAELGVPIPRLHLIPPGIDPAPYERPSVEAVDALRDRFGLKGKKVILTLARLAPRKGHDVVVRTLKGLSESVPDVHYLIVGSGDPQTLNALAAEEGVGDRVSIVSYVTDSELPTLFKLCDVYAMVSRWDPVAREVEGFGIVYLEAAASGKPCVAGSHGGAGDAVEDGVTGFVIDPTSAEAVQAALRTLLTDDTLARSMGEAGRKRVRREFDRALLLRRIEEVLLTAAGQGPS